MAAWLPNKKIIFCGICCPDCLRLLFECLNENTVQMKKHITINSHKNFATVFLFLKFAATIIVSQYFSCVSFSKGA